MLNKLFLSIILILFSKLVCAQNEIDYFPQNAKKQNIIITVENANIIKRDTLNFRLNFYNSSINPVSLVKIDTSYVSSSVMIIYIYENDINNRGRVYLTNRADQLAGIHIKKTLNNLVILSPHEGFYQDFSIPFHAKKNKQYMLQIVLDYDYTIVSPISLTNLVQQELESNILDIVYK